MKSGISVGAAKEAALYFDYVLPDDILPYVLGETVDFQELRSESVPLLDKGKLSRVAKCLLPHVRNSQEIVENFTSVTSLALAVSFHSLPEEEVGFPTDLSSGIKLLHQHLTNRGLLGCSVEDALQNRANFRTEIALVRRKLIVESGVDESVSWISDALLRKSIAPRATETTSLGERFALSIKNLHLVDPSQLSWDEIIEFRKDRKALSALRNLRLFFNEDLSDKSQAYIEDKLEQLHDRYCDESKQWRFQLAHRTLSVMFDNSSVLAGTAATLAAAVVGGSLSAAAVAGAVVPIGRVLLEFGRGAMENRTSVEAGAVQYLTQLKELGSKSR